VQFTIVEQQHLGELHHALAPGTQVALDTEFVRRRTFYPELGLIQLKIDSRIWLIDPLQAFSQDALKAALAHTYWVLHSGSEDFEVLLTAGVPAPPAVFDTQLAAAFCGRGGQLSYQALCASCLGFDLAKDETQSDWLKRPLSEQQLRYAAADVEHLLDLQKLLTNELTQTGRLGWFQTEQAARLRALGAPHDAKDELKRYRQAVKLKPVQQQRLLRLIEWRELQARERNLPRAWVLEHNALIDWAERPPRDLGQLGRSISDRNFVARREAAALFALLHADPEDASPVIVALSPTQNDALAQIKKLATAKSEALNLPLELLAPRKLLERYVIGDSTGMGEWRRDVLGL